MLPLPPQHPLSSLYPSQLFFGTSQDLSQAASPPASPEAIQHQKPGSLEAATLTVLSLQKLSQQARARKQVLTSSWLQPTLLCAGWSLLCKYYAGLLWIPCLLGLGKLNILYIIFPCLWNNLRRLLSMKMEQSEELRKCEIITITSE